MSEEGTVVIAMTDEPTDENDQPEEMEVIQAEENDLKNARIGCLRKSLYKKSV